MKKQKTAITPTRQENYADWYQAVVKGAKLASQAEVRGCMNVLPWGYQIWERIQEYMNGRFRLLEIPNAYFPMFMPLSKIQKEAEHVEGFAKECAVVTHTKLEKGADGTLVPAGELEEAMIVRPTSEMIIADYFKAHIHSYRDLPLKVNQWCNVVRWEMRTRMFLRTTEFLWHEAHTAHATKKEASTDAEAMIREYEKLAREILAIPVLIGVKTEAEKFPGAERTYTIEAMMQDQKALQMGTSHFLGQNFSKAGEIRFNTKDEKQEHPYTGSFGLTTRLLGALIMTHSDDDGLVLPPRATQSHVKIIPFIKSEEDRAEITDYCCQLKKDLEEIEFFDQWVGVICDEKDISPSEKKWDAIRSGIPIILEVGKRDIEGGTLMVRKRVGGVEKLTREKLINSLSEILEQMQHEIFEKALHFRNAHTHEATTKEAFFEIFEKENAFVLAPYCDDPKIEDEIAEKCAVTARCILPTKNDSASCIFSGKPTTTWAVFAKAY
ncbi:MAG: Proline--tRNA ligase [Chlamydiia bacterium]|nr:Proline--tRNA ligase [Chlamydiia bacterium]